MSIIVTGNAGSGMNWGTATGATYDKYSGTATGTGTGDDLLNEEEFVAYMASLNVTEDVARLTFMLVNSDEGTANNTLNSTEFDAAKELLTVIQTRLLSSNSSDAPSAIAMELMNKEDVLKLISKGGYQGTSIAETSYVSNQQSRYNTVLSALIKLLDEYNRTLGKAAG